MIVIILLLVVFVAIIWRAVNLYMNEKEHVWAAWLQPATILSRGMLRTADGETRSFCWRECLSDGTKFDALMAGQQVWVGKIDGSVPQLYVTIHGPRRIEKRHASLDPRGPSDGYERQGETM